MQECGLPMMSLETSGSVQYSRMPLSGPSAAVLIAALTWSLVAVVFSRAVRSVTEPTGTGTRSEKPVSLPFNSGMTSPTALAAPVLEGMMFTAAARAR